MAKLQMYDFLFLDERDSPNLTELKNKSRSDIKSIPNKRFFGLCGITLSGVNYPDLNINGHKLQEKFFGPENYSPLHYYEMLNSCGKFSFVNNGDNRKITKDRLDSFIKTIDFKIIGSFIDKSALALQYGRFTDSKFTQISKIKPNLTPITTPSKINLYDVALKFILKDYYSYLKDRHRKGLIIAEARGEKEDIALLNSFFRFQRIGTGSLSGKEVRENIIDLLVVKKVQNHIGIQLADLITYPFYDYFVPNHNTRNDHLIKKERLEEKIYKLSIFPK